MKINGLSTEELYGVKEWTLERSYAALENTSEMPERWLTPIMIPSQVGLKTIRVTLMIEGDRAQIWRKGGAFVGALLYPVEVQFNDFPDRYFKCAIKNASHVEACLRRWHKATVELVGYEYGAYQEVTGTGVTVTVNNAGDIITPCNVSVRPNSNMTSLAISGLCRDPYTREGQRITMNGLTSGVTRIIDTERGFITENGVSKFEQTDMMDFPSLLPGANAIGLNRSGITMTISFRPYYL